MDIANPNHFDSAFCLGRRIISILNRLRQITPTNPLPTLGDVKGDFVGGDFGERLLFLDLAGFDEALLFGLDLAIEFFACSFFGALVDKLTLDRHLEKRLLHVAREALVEVLQLAPRLLVAVNIRQQFLNLRHNALLLGQGRERDGFVFKKFIVPTISTHLTQIT